MTGVALTYELADGAETHAPMVIGRVGARTMRFVLDTGSDVHLLTKELVDDLGLTHAPGEDGTDHSGASIPSWSVEDVELELGSLSLALREVVSIPAPPVFVTGGVGGILSPQRLGERVTLDLAAGRLVIGADDASVLVRRDPAYGAIVVPATVGAATVAMLLNTGGRESEIAAELAGQGVSAADVSVTGKGVGGGDVVSIGRVDAPVRIGEVALTASFIVRETMRGPQAMLGMDVLRGWVIGLSPEAVTLSLPI